MSGVAFTVGFMFSEDLQEVVLIDKQRPDWQKDKFNGPGGHVKLGESPVGCMVREFREETGIVTTKDDWVPFHYQRQFKTDNRLHFYYAVKPLEVLLSAKTTTDEEVQVFSTHVLLNAFADAAKGNTRRYDYYVYNLGYLLHMAIVYHKFPEHRYLEG